MTKIEPIKTFCNEGCQKPFSITKMPTVKVKQGIDKTYFRCPHCKHEYVAHYSSKETLKLQKQMRKFHRTAYAPGSNMNSEEIAKLETELKAEIKKSMDDARTIAES